MYKRQVPELLRQHGITAAMLLEDEHTHTAAGAEVAELLRKAGVTVYEHIYQRAEGWLTADEEAMDEGAQAFGQCGELSLIHI